MLNIAIFDKHPVFILGLTDLLTTAGFHVIDSDTTIHWPCSLHTDVFLVDVDTMESAEEIVPELAKIAPVLLIVAAEAQEADGYIALGVAGTIDRRSSAEDLLSAVGAALAGGRTGLPGTAPAQQRHSSNLSPREQQVIRHIAGGLTHGQVARLLGISPHTVDTYVKRIRSKLDLGNKAELTRAAIDVGLGQR